MNGLKIFEVHAYTEDGIEHFMGHHIVIAENAEEAAEMVRQLLWDIWRTDVESCDVFEIVFEKGIIGVPPREVAI